MNNLYVDANKGSDSNVGTKISPFQTFEKAMNSLPVETGEVTIFLGGGEYYINTHNPISSKKSGHVIVEGIGEKTILQQNQQMPIGDNGYVGSTQFTLTIRRLIYHFKENSGENYNSFLWTWNFYNVLISGMKTKSVWTATFIPNRGGILNIDYCVRIDESTCFLRADNGPINVTNSMGYFTTGYGTTQQQWDKGGNQLGTTEGYMKVLNTGKYRWNYDGERIVFCVDEKYGYFSLGKWNEISFDVSLCEVQQQIPKTSIIDLNPGNYEFTHLMTANASAKQYNGVIDFNDEGLKNIKRIDVREVENDG